MKKQPKHYRYPFVSRARKEAFFGAAFFWRLRSRTLLRPSPCLEQSGFGGIKLNPINTAPIPTSESQLLIVICYNSVHEIEKFYDHYRRLGVDRFIVIDDGSKDGTIEFLTAQPDTDLFVSNVPYGAGRDRVWRQQVIERYGRDRWYLSVDSDEYLVFEDSEKNSLRKLIRVLEQRQEYHLEALMIDLYPDGLIDSAVENPRQMPWETCPLFDSDSYLIRPQLRSISIRGGPRGRLFGFEGRMNKYPLFYADRVTSFDLNAHTMFPYHRNFVPVRAALLHNKYAPGARRRLSKIAERGRHNGSDLGPLIADDFRYSGSMRYVRSRQLADLGLIEKSFS